MAFALNFPVAHLRAANKVTRFQAAAVEAAEEPAAGIQFYDGVWEPCIPEV